MENYNSEKIARVWQRVRGEGGDIPQAELPRQQGLSALIVGEQTDATIYLILSRRFQGKQASILRRMFEEEQAHTACLKGIYTLITGQRPVTKALPLPQETTEGILRRCYGREMHCLAEYEARSKDPEYGQIFAGLAAQEREHCHRILELLGGLKK